MRGVVFLLSHLSSILLVSLLVFSTQLLGAQRTSTLQESAVQPPDAPSQVVTVLEAQDISTYRLQRITLELQTKSVPDRVVDEILPRSHGLRSSFYQYQYRAEQDTKTAEFWGKNKYFIGSAPSKLMTFAPTFGQVHHETIHGVNDLEYYSHHLPWAGSVILRIGQQAKAHPHVISVLKTVHPRF